MPHHVAIRVQALGLREHCGSRVGDGLPDVVRDLDQVQRAAGGLRVVGGHQRDRFALVADPVDGEHRLVPALEAVGVGARHVLVGEHREHSRQGERSRRLQPDDGRVRVGAAQRRAPQHAVHPEVGGERELPLHLRGAVRSRRAGADPRGDRAGQRLCARLRGHDRHLPLRPGQQPAGSACGLGGEVALVGGHEHVVRHHGPPSTNRRASGGATRARGLPPGRRCRRGPARPPATARRRRACLPRATRSRRRAPGTVRHRSCREPAPAVQ